jgi:hypothetical protein
MVIDQMLYILAMLLSKIISNDSSAREQGCQLVPDFHTSSGDYGLMHYLI